MARTDDCSTYPPSPKEHSTITHPQNMATARLSDLCVVCDGNGRFLGLANAAMEIVPVRVLQSDGNVNDGDGDDGFGNGSTTGVAPFRVSSRGTADSASNLMLSFSGGNPRHSTYILHEVAKQVKSNATAAQRHASGWFDPHFVGDSREISSDGTFEPDFYSDSDSDSEVDAPDGIGLNSGSHRGWGGRGGGDGRRNSSHPRGHRGGRRGRGDGQGFWYPHGWQRRRRRRHLYPPGYLFGIPPALALGGLGLGLGLALARDEKPGVDYHQHHGQTTAYANNNLKPLIPYVPETLLSMHKEFFPQTYFHINSNMPGLIMLGELPSIRAENETELSTELASLRKAHMTVRKSGYEVVPNFDLGIYQWARLASAESGGV